MSAEDPRVERLLDELLDSNSTPEEVCADCPELLPRVRKYWRRIRWVDAELNALFPESGDREVALVDVPELPRIEGYEVASILGRGGMGIIFRAHHLRLNRPVALKMILAGPYADPDERKRFVQEAEAVASLRHPNIVQVYDAGEIDGRPYFTMELVEGGRLSQKVSGVPQPAREAAALVAAVADAIQAAHEKGIVHRDLTPSNILLTADGTPKVTDFGLARRIDVRSEITLTGMAVGTPAYMAPEQARGEKAAIGPATDIYALGAMLYDLLTGRPPFQADTAAATLRQVVTDEPVRPSRLNPRVPRDLETICLKCLHKDPRRRYASAGALVDDVRRFERGEPITARPVSAIERAVRWAGRRPALAGALASGFLLALALLVTIVRWQMQRTALAATAAAYAEADLRESERLRDLGELKTSAAVLKRARERLVGFVSPTMQDRLSTASDGLELLTRLEAIRQERALVKPPAEVLTVLMPAIDAAKENSPGRHYEEAFRAAGVGGPEENAAAAATRIHGSPVGRALVAALDDWAACAADRRQLDWVLKVLRQADPDPWRNRVRDPATWDDADAPGDLTARVRLAEQSPQLLTVLGGRLRAKKIDAVPFLSRVAAAYPNDFWANIELGNAFLDQSNAGDAAESYRAASELRPGTFSVHYALGCMYLGLRRWDRCIAEYEQALRIDPACAWCHNRIGVALAFRGGHDDEAIAQYRESIRLDPTIGWTHHHLATILEHLGRDDEAAAEFREAARLFPEKRAEWKRDLRRVLFRLGRVDELLADWKQDLEARPGSYDEWFGYVELCLYHDDQPEYRRVRRELLAQFGATDNPDIAERTARAALLLPPSRDELDKAVALSERAVGVGRRGHEYNFPYYRFAQGLTRYRQGRFDDAISIMTGDAAKSLGACPLLVLAMAQQQKGRGDEARRALDEAIRLYDWTAKSADHPDMWTAHILRREAESLIRPQLPIPASSSPASNPSART